jgi:hypothetical protein
MDVDVDVDVKNKKTKLDWTGLNWTGLDWTFATPDASQLGQGWGSGF